MIFDHAEAFRVAYRAVADQRGMAIPPEEFDSVQVRRNGRPTINWTVILEYSRMLFFVTMGPVGENVWVHDEQPIKIKAGG